MERVRVRWWMFVERVEERVEVVRCGVDLEDMLGWRSGLLED